MGIGDQRYDVFSQIARGRPARGSTKATGRPVFFPIHRYYGSSAAFVAIEHR
jgi:hypothetical protein